MNYKLQMKHLGTLKTCLWACKSWSLVISCWLFIIGWSYSQVSAEIDTTRIKIGEQIRYKISVEADSTNSVVFPEGQTFLPLEMVEGLKIDTNKTNNKFKLLKEYKLTQFDSGTYTIPRQKIIIGDKTYLTDSLLVKVRSIEVDTTKQGLYDIKPIIEVNKSASKWWLYILVVLAILSLIAFLLYWFIWREKPLTEEEEIALLPAYERAKLSIVKLDEKGFLQRLELKAFYSELTYIIRKFLDEKVYEHAMESTTDQLVDRLQLLKDGNQFPFKKETIQNIESILKRADLVKFAKSKPDIELAKLDKNTIDQEIDAVKATLPEPSEEEKLLNQHYKEAQERKKKRRKLLITVSISAFFVIATFIGFGFVYGFGYVKDTIIGHDTKKLLEGEWVSSAYGFPPIYIETPKVLKRQDIKLPEEIKDKAKMAMFAYGNLKERFYVATATTNLAEVDTTDFDVQRGMNINAVIEGNLKTWESKGVRNIVTKNEQFVTPNAAEGLKTFGSAEFPSLQPDNYEAGKYTILSFTTERIIQQIVIVWRSDDNYAQDIVDKIVASVELNPNASQEEQTK